MSLTSTQSCFQKYVEHGPVLYNILEGGESLNNFYVPCYFLTKIKLFIIIISKYISMSYFYTYI